MKKTALNFEGKNFFDKENIKNESGDIKKNNKNHSTHCPVCKINHQPNLNPDGNPFWEPDWEWCFDDE